MQTREVSVFKNGLLSFTFIDTFNNLSSTFTREQPGSLAVIDKVANKILYSETSLNTRFISVKKRGPELKRNANISAFDI